MPTKFVNVLETSKLRIRGHYFDSVSYVLLNFVTLRLFENLAPEGKGGKTRRRMASERQINSLPGLLAVKNRLTHQSTIHINKLRQWRTRTEHCRLKSLPPLMRGLDIHKNSPVSVTKLTLGLQVGFISSHLTANKLFPVSLRAITWPPKMSLLLEAKSMPAWSSNQGLSLLRRRMTLVGT